MTEVVAALIWNKDEFMICQHPAQKSAASCWNLSALQILFPIWFIPRTNLNNVSFRISNKTGSLSPRLGRWL